ncbi:hypothetical protein [Roseicyclus persicicus]|uniref:DUF1176 domain-containing protein n=1 Tax=Roseicyclus persicicus TaxID=2650661 RepID=A0A7X6JX00_9RHOB|nr:hypothetical protein [Roseibacterium persicicum]NKX44997.1 hypothetical protein [Roseibacterium persicicum]
MKLLPVLMLPSLALGMPALADTLDDRATAVFSAAYADTCYSAFLEDGRLIEPPRRYAVVSPMTYGDAPVPMEVWLFRCNVGAYNVQSVLIGYTEADGITPLSVASPDLDIVLEDPDDLDSAVREVRIVGWSASQIVVNAEIDTAIGELREIGYWRGMGDASSAAVWRLVDLNFRLVRYDVDPTYDGEVNPTTLVLFD